MDHVTNFLHFTGAFDKCLTSVIRSISKLEILVMSNLCVFYVMSFLISVDCVKCHRVANIVFSFQC